MITRRSALACNKRQYHFESERIYRVRHGGFQRAKLTAADGTAIAAADVKDAGVNKSIYCLTLTPRLTVLNMGR